jgi:hypothetical protein
MSRAASVVAPPPKVDGGRAVMSQRYPAAPAVLRQELAAERDRAGELAKQAGNGWPHTPGPVNTKEDVMATTDDTFIYVATYPNEATAQDDYQVVKELHAPRPGRVL